MLKKINQHFSSYFALSKSIAFITSLILESLSQREQFHIRMTGTTFWSKFEKKFVNNKVITNPFCRSVYYTKEYLTTSYHFVQKYRYQIEKRYKNTFYINVKD